MTATLDTVMVSKTTCTEKLHENDMQIYFPHDLKVETLTSDIHTQVRSVCILSGRIFDITL